MADNSALASSESSLSRVRVSTALACFVLRRNLRVRATPGDAAQSPAGLRVTESPRHAAGYPTQYAAQRAKGGRGRCPARPPPPRGPQLQSSCRGASGRPPARARPTHSVAAASRRTPCRPSASGHHDGPGAPTRSKMRVTQKRLSPGLPTMLPPSSMQRSKPRCGDATRT